MYKEIIFHKVEIILGRLHVLGKLKVVPASSETVEVVPQPLRPICLCTLRLVFLDGDPNLAL